MNRLPVSERSDTWLTYGEQKHHVHLSHTYTKELSAPTGTMTRTPLHIDACGTTKPG